MKKNLLLLSLGAIISLCACGSTDGSASKTADSSSSPVTESSSIKTESSEKEEKAAKLTQALSSPAQFTYSNMRPGYNYYTTTYAFETLDLFDDGTYQLNEISMTFSGVVLPEEGNGGTGNERTNFVKRYYGKFSSSKDELDEDILNVSLGSPDRIVFFNDASEFYDTANWTALMSKKAGTTYSYDENYQLVPTEGEKSALDYLKENVFTSLELSAVVSEAKIDFVAITVGNENAKLGTYNDGLNGGYSSPAQFAYSNMRPSYNYYTMEFDMQTLETYNDGTYVLNQYSSVFSGVVLPESGNDGTANERTNYQLSVYGTYTSEVDDLDEDTTHVHLSEATRIVKRYDAAEFYDTANWTAVMSKKAGTTYSYDENYQLVPTEGEKSAAEYLAENKTPAVDADVLPKEGKLDFITFEK